MNDNEHQNESIERNLRNAHQQVLMRPEFSARVLSAIASEIQSDRKIFPTRELEPCKPPTRTIKDARQLTPMRLALHGIALLAAALLVSMLLFQSTSSVKKLSIDSRDEQFRVGDVDWTSGLSKERSQPNTDSSVFPVSVPAVRAEPGYVAGKLYVDDEIEIYMVLPAFNSDKTVN